MMSHNARSPRHWLALGLALVVGVVLGAVTTTAADGTPFSQGDLNRALEDSFQDSQATVEEFRQSSAKTYGDLEDARTQISRLRERNAETSTDLEVARRQVSRLRDRSASLERTLDEVRITNSEPAALTFPVAPSGLVESHQPPSDASSSESPGTGLRVTGNLKTTWILTSQLKPWPSDCSGVLKSYQVRVNTGDGATVTIAQLTGSRVAKRSEKHGILSLECSTTYQATIAAPLDAVYEFQAVGASEPDKPLRTALVQMTEISAGQAPELYVSFCPEC